LRLRPPHAGMALSGPQVRFCASGVIGGHFAMLMQCATREPGE
jgi:hypothetical protein